MIMDLDKFFFALNGTEIPVKIEMGGSPIQEVSVNSIPRPKKIVEGISHKDGKTVTVVFWDDGTKTKVCNMEQDKPDRYMAFCAALAKKLYGTTDKAQKMVENAVVES